MCRDRIVGRDGRGQRRHSRRLASLYSVQQTNDKHPTAVVQRYHAGSYQSSALPMINHHHDIGRHPQVPESLQLEC